MSLDEYVKNLNAGAKEEHELLVQAEARLGRAYTEQQQMNNKIQDLEEQNEELREVVEKYTQAVRTLHALNEKLVKKWKQ